MMKRLTMIMIACLCAVIALPSAFAGESKKQGAETKPAAAKPAAPAMKYKEAPMLAELVKAGKLPPVDQRLPENPLVVPGGRDRPVRRRVAPRLPRARRTSTASTA